MAVILVLVAVDADPFSTGLGDTREADPAVNSGMNCIIPVVIADFV